MIKLYKDGDSMAIKTDCKNEEDFINQFSRLLESMIDEGKYHNDWHFQLSYWLPQFVDICCKLRGYKNSVTERHILIAGQIFEGDECAGIDDREKVSYKDNELKQAS